MVVPPNQPQIRQTRARTFGLQRSQKFDAFDKVYPGIGGKERVALGERGVWWRLHLPPICCA